MDSMGSLDYYQILGLARTATEDDIRRAYRREALKWHPDKHQGQDKDNAEIRFKLVSEAYDVLKDGNTRQIYDRHGLDGLKGRNFQNNYQYDPRADFHPFQFRRPEDIFREFFGNRNPFDDMFEFMPNMPMMNGFMSHSSSLSDPFSNFPFGPFRSPAGPTMSMGMPSMFHQGSRALHEHQMGSSTSFSFSSSSSSSDHYTSRQSSTSYVNGEKLTRTKIIDSQGNTTEEIILEKRDGTRTKEMKVNGQRTEYLVENPRQPRPALPHSH